VAGRRKGRERVKTTAGVLGGEEEGAFTLTRFAHCFFLLSLPFDACHAVFLTCWFAKYLKNEKSE